MSRAGLPGVDVVIDRLVFLDPDVSPGRAARIRVLLEVEMSRLLEQQGLAGASSAMTVRAPAIEPPGTTGERRVAAKLARSVLHAVGGR